MHDAVFTVGYVGLLVGAVAFFLLLAFPGDL